MTGMNTVRARVGYMFRLFLMMLALSTCTKASATPSDSEQRLLHLRLDVGSLKLWQNDSLQEDTLRLHKSITVVHLFSLDCPPCLDELPQLKSLFRDGLPDIDYVLVLETPDPPRIRDFLRKHAAILPQVPLYISTDKRMRSTAQLGIETVPVTLLLDDQQVVRQAFVGSLKERRTLYESAQTRLIRAIGMRQPLFVSRDELGAYPLGVERLLNRRIDVNALLTTIGTAGQRERKPAPKLQLVYLGSADCQECQTDLRTRLPRIIEGWAGHSEIRYVFLDCSQDGMERNQVSADAVLERRIERGRCDQGNLMPLWQQDKRPVLLLLDSDSIIRDAFVGSIPPGVGRAMRRLVELNH